MRDRSLGLSLPACGPVFCLPHGRIFFPHVCLCNCFLHVWMLSRVPEKGQHVVVSNSHDMLRKAMTFILNDRNYQYESPTLSRKVHGRHFILTTSLATTSPHRRGRPYTHNEKKENNIQPLEGDDIHTLLSPLAERT